jgi:hypothetical protein
MNIFDAIKMARAAGETLKALQDIDHAIDKAELKSKLADAIGNLADVRIALADMRDDFDVKDAEIAKLKAAFALRSDLVESDGYKYRVSAEKPDGFGWPMCPRCESVDGRLILTVGTSYRGAGCRCPQCKAEYPSAWAKPS